MFKPHRAACSNCKHIRIIVVKKGLCAVCNEAKKRENKGKSRFPPPIAKRSEKRVKADVAYKTLRLSYLASHPDCEAKLFGCTGRGEDIHHLKFGKDREASMNDFAFVK